MSSTEFPSGWDELTIKKATILLKDGSHGTHKDVDGGIPLLSAKDIRHGRVWFENDPRHISRDDFNQIHKNYKLCNGDVLVTIVGTLGRIARVQNYSSSYTLQRSVAVLRFNNSLVDSEYAYYLLTAPRFQADLKRRENRGAQGGVYLGEIAKIKILIPSLPMQRNIVQILNTWDEYLDNLGKKIHVKKKVKKGLAHQLLARKVRLSGFNEKWAPVELGKIAKVTMGQSPLSDSYNSDGDGYVLIQGNADMKAGKTIERVWTTTPTKVAQSGSLIMTVRAPVGKLAFSGSEVCIGRGVCAITGDYTRFLYYYLEHMSNSWARLIQGSTFESVNGADVRGLRLIAPPQNEADAICKVLDVATKEIEELTELRNIIFQQKNYLLNNLLNGKIRVSEDLKLPIGEALYA